MHSFYSGKLSAPCLIAHALVPSFLCCFIITPCMYDVSVQVTRYTLPSLFWHPFQLSRIMPVIIFLVPFLTNVLLLVVLSHFQAIHHMWRRSQVSNEHLLNSLVDCLIFAQNCIIAKKELVMIYFFSENGLFPFFYSIIFLFLPEDFFSRPFLWKYVRSSPYFFLL